MQPQQQDERWESPLRKVARNSAKRREYSQLLREHQQKQLPRPQTGPLQPVSIDNYANWYDYVDALELQRQLREAQEHAERMSVEREKTRRHITRILSFLEPPTVDTGEIQRIEDEATTLMPALPSPRKRREVRMMRGVEEIASFLDHAIRLYVFEHKEPPSHIRLSSYNYRRLSLEFRGQILSAYTNQRGTFFLAPDYRLDDQTVICEE